MSNVTDKNCAKLKKSPKIRVLLTIRYRHGVIMETFANTTEYNLKCMLATTGYSEVIDYKIIKQPTTKRRMR